MITFAKKFRFIIFAGVICIINLCAQFIRIVSSNNFLNFKFIPVQLQLYIPSITDSLCIYKKNNSTLIGKNLYY